MRGIGRLGNKNPANRSQSGMVAIMVTLIMMIVISLLVLGFAQVSRHEQHNTLDNQLSSQAYYAAESGVNDAVSVIRARLASGSSLPGKSTCKDTPEYKFSTTDNLSGDGTVSYSCVLINPAPMELDYTVGNDPVVIPIISGSGASFKTVTISWTPVANPDGSMPSSPLNGCLNTAGNLPPTSGAGAWSCDYPLLRTELVPTGSLSRSGLLSSSRVNFLEPVTSGAGVMAISQNGKVQGASCTNGSTGTCKVVMNGFSGANYYMRLGSIYGATRVKITATDASGPDGLEGAQTDIDSTGDAHGVLRRVLVAVDLNDANSVRLPSAGLTVGDSICKRFTVAKDFFGVTGDLPGGNGNPLCAVTEVFPPPPPPTGSACGIDKTMFNFNLKEYNYPDWHVKNYDIGKVANHPISNTSHPASIPPGTYRYGAGALDNHPNPTATNRKLHYNFYNGSTLVGRTADTPNMPPKQTSIWVTGTITFTQPVTSFKVEHGPKVPSFDDSIDSGCLALGV